MALKPAVVPPATQWSVRGLQMLQAGDVNAAKESFLKAVKLDKTSADHRLCLAIAHKALREHGPAAEQLTEALRLNPKMDAAAEQLSGLVVRGLIPANAKLNVIGLKAALAHDQFDRDLVAEASMFYLAQSGVLKTALERGRADGWVEAARGLCLKKTGDLLRDDLFVKAIEDNVIRMPDLEHLLTALRRVILLELPADRFDDRQLADFIVALARQCWVNEYVWTVSDEEKSALGTIAVQPEALLAGNAAAGVIVLKEALYRPISDIIDPRLADVSLTEVRPKALRTLIAQHMAARASETAHAGRMPKHGAITDETSRKVAAMYREYPYPRWTCHGQFMKVPETRKMLVRYFGPDSTAFMDQPFDVLIAGCGTGRQAIASAAAYGPNARVLAIDLSTTSLAYAARMAEKSGVTNITFAQADIGDLAGNAEFTARFQIIECAGVLHHMADPFAGWRALNACLADGGKMMIGLYSQTGRAKWMAWKRDPSYPGAGCGVDALRAFRRDLLARPDSDLGPEFRGIRDLYTMSGFRDLFFHVSERNHTIPEIAAFMDDAGLAFRGFHNPQNFERLRRRYPSEVWPGSLQTWTAFEAENPLTFAGMYLIWCERKAVT